MRPRQTRFIHPKAHLQTDAKEESIPQKNTNRMACCLAGTLTRQNDIKYAKRRCPLSTTTKKYGKPATPTMQMAWSKQAESIMVPDEYKTLLIFYECLLDPFPFSGSLRRETKT